MIETSLGDRQARMALLKGHERDHLQKFAGFTNFSNQLKSFFWSDKKPYCEKKGIIVVVSNFLLSLQTVCCIKA